MTTVGIRFPDFLCIGAQKAGTTWLHQKLSQHPAIWLPPLKEVHYFDAVYGGGAYAERIAAGRHTAALRQIEWTLKSDAPPRQKLERVEGITYTGLPVLSDEWYGRLFGRAPDEAVCGEITPEYAMLPEEGIQHIVRVQPAVKVLFIMRDPIDRAWSALRMMRKQARSQGSPEPELETRGTKFYERADYMGTIERFRRHVQESRFMCLFFDDLENAPRKFLRGACDFLGVDFSEATFKGLSKKTHKGDETPITPAIYTRLRDELKPAYDDLRRLHSDVVEAWYARHYG